MDEKLRRLREHMNQTVLKDVDFSESNKEKVRRAVRAETDQAVKKPWIYQLKNALSVAVLLLLFGGIIYAIQQQSPDQTGQHANNQASQQSSASHSSATSHHGKTASGQKNATNNKFSKSRNDQVMVANSTYIVRMMPNDVGWKLTTYNVLRTTNGGQNWMARNPTGKEPPHFEKPAFFLNASDAWVTAVYRDGTKKQFYTTDGGQHWTPSKSTVQPDGKLDFINQYEGWMLKTSSLSKKRDQIEIYRTSNRGKSWEPMAKTDNLGTLPSTGKVTGIGFSTQSNVTGWLSGYEPGTYGDPWLYQTNDGGNTWTKDSVSLNSQWKKNQIKTFPPMFLGGGTLLPVTMANPRSGELKRIAFYKYDGGKRWSEIGSQSIQSSQVIYDFRNIDHGWIVTDQAVYHTSDRTQHWSMDKAGPIFRNTMHNGKAEELDIVDSSTARLLVKMNDGTTKLLMTRNDGKNWTLSGL